MKTKDAFRLLGEGILRKCVKVKMSGLKGFDKFTEIDDVFVKRARPGEIEDDWVVVMIEGQMYDAFWIDEIEGYNI